MERALVSNPERKAMRAMRAKGALIREIHARFPRWTYSAIRIHVAGVLPHRRVPDADKAAMRRMRADGLTIEAINANFSFLCYHTVTRIVKGVLPGRKPARRDRKVDPLAALRLREDHGMQFKDIGERFGVSKPAAFQAYRNAVRQREEARA